MCFVYIETVYAKLLECDYIVFLPLSLQLFKLHLQVFSGSLQLLYGESLRTAFL